MKKFFDFLLHIKITFNNTKNIKCDKKIISI